MRAISTAATEGATFPNPANVLAGTLYGPTGVEFVGTLVVPTANDIAAAVLAALNATVIPVDAKRMNGAEIIGDGAEATPWSGNGVVPPADLPPADAIAAAVLAALSATTIPVDIQRMNGAEVIGLGTEGDAWRGVGVQP